MPVAQFMKPRESNTGRGWTGPTNYADQIATEGITDFGVACRQ